VNASGYSIARALMKDAPILILDEPTSALDGQTEGLLLVALRRLTQGRTTLVIAHRLSTIQNADQIIVMDRGRIVQKGSHDQLLADEGLYGPAARPKLRYRVVGDGVMKAIVTGMIATYPVGGVAWDYGQYALGLEKLGFEVYYLEDCELPSYSIDPATGLYVEDCRDGVRFLQESLALLSPTLARLWHFRDGTGANPRYER